MRTLHLLALATIAALLCNAIALFAGYQWGASATENAQAAKAKSELDHRFVEQAAEIDRLQTATADHLASQRAMEASYAELERTHQDLLSRHQLVVARPRVGSAAVRACPSRVDRDLVVDEPTTAAAAPRELSAETGRVELPDRGDAVGDEPELTLAAVRVWNGALFGADAPAGACGAAGTPEGADSACAHGSGLTLVDAWANHTLNAQACAEDRQRYRDLIGYLTRSPMPER